MGIYPRLAAAFLALFVLSSEAAKRQTVSHGQSASSMINGQTANTGSVSTPAGSAAFFGQAYTSYHTPGERFNGGDSVPNSGSGSSSAKQAVDVTPGNYFNKARAAAMAKNAIKGGVVAVVATAAVEWAINQIPNAGIVGGTPVMHPEMVTSITYWDRENVPGSDKYTDPVAACNTFWANGAGLAAGQTFNHIQTNSNEWACRAQNPFYFFDYVRSYTVTCSTGFGPNGECTGAAPAPSPFTESNYGDLEAALASMNNNPWLQDLIKASCNGSLNPDACFDSLVDNPFVIGPAFQTGKSSSTTTTTTNPDGTTSSSTVTSTPSYSYTYGSNYYDYTTTTTTTTNNNGQVTTTVSTDTSEGTPEEDPASEEEKEEETDFSGEYTDAPFSPVTPFYEQKYPEGLQGVWDSASAQVSSSAFLQFLQSFVPSFSGSCPSWSLSFNIMPQAMFGTFEFMSLCYVFDFVKIILMATAVFCARWIMFGG